MSKFKTLSKSTQSNFFTYVMVTVAFILLNIWQTSGSMSSLLKGQLVPICAYVVMAVSLNLTIGIMGELSLGHAGFMSMGAFSGVIAAFSLQNLIAQPMLRLAVSMLIGGIIAGLVSLIVVVPVLRLQGDYLAIVTLAFGEIIKNIVNCLYAGMDKNGLHISMSNTQALGMDPLEGKVIMQGPMGLLGIPKLSTFTMGFVLVIVTLVVVLNFINSRSGRAVMAIRDNRIAAESVGINITRYKIMAFVTSAVLAGMAGGLYAMNFSTIVAKKFDFNTSILVLVFVVLGGIGNIRGSVIAAVVLTILPELLREFHDYRMLIYAVVLVLVMILSNNPQLKQKIDELKAWYRRGKEAKIHGTSN